MACYLLTWNPFKTPWEDLEKDIDRCNRNKFLKLRWSCGVTKRIEKGNRLFMLRQAVEPRGIFASGWATSDVYEDDHWDWSSHMPTALYVNVRLDMLLNPKNERILTREELKRAALGGMHWDCQASGVTIPDAIARELEKKWVALSKAKKTSKKQSKRGRGIRRA
jgi:5-methylcytosine-specific restriction protein A